MFSVSSVTQQGALKTAREFSNYPKHCKDSDLSSGMKPFLNFKTDHMKILQYQSFHVLAHTWSLRKVSLLSPMSCHFVEADLTNWARLTGWCFKV